MVKERIGDVFSLDGKRLEAIRNVIDNSQIDQRHSVFPADYIIQPRPLSQINTEYREKAVELGLEVTAQALAQAGMSPSDIDLLITVSCTGVMIPSLDAYIATEMGFRSGCAEASHYRTWVRGRRRGTRPRLGISVGISGSNGATGSGGAAYVDVSAQGFFPGEFDFGGAIWRWRGGRGHHRPRSCWPRIVASESFLFPNSLDAMGFDLRDSGFHIVLSKDVPQLIAERVKGLVDGFLARQGLTREDLSAFLLHPGGQKLLSFMEAELELDRSDTEISWDVLRRFGNLSSASVLFILQETLARREMPSGSYGLLMAFGPGFTAEMILLQWP